MNKLAIVTTHPIQYYAPAFKLLALVCELKVFYTWGNVANGDKFDPDFGKKVDWDIPLLEGYKYEFLENKSKTPGSNHFKGIVNPDLVNKIKDFKPSAILFYGWGYHSHLKAIRHFKGKIPIWFRGDSNLLDKQSVLKKALRRIFLSWVYSHVNRAFYVGTANKSYYQAFGLKENQLTFAPHAIDNERFSSDHTVEAVALRKKLSISTEDILILFAGKLEHKKDPELLLEAFLKLDRPKTHLLIVGNGKLEQHLKLKVAREQAEKVHFMDFQNQSQMPIVYQACDIFCLPSKGPGETWGLAVNEAMASGKAILTSSKVGCAEDLVKPTNGCVFRSEDLDELKCTLNLMLTSNMKTLGEGSRKLINLWTFEKQINAIKSELEKIGKSSK